MKKTSQSDANILTEGIRVNEPIPSGMVEVTCKALLVEGWHNVLFSTKLVSPGYRFYAGLFSGGWHTVIPLRVNPVGKYFRAIAPKEDPLSAHPDGDKLAARNKSRGLLA